MTLLAIALFFKIYFLFLLFAIQTTNCVLCMPPLFSLSLSLFRMHCFSMDIACILRIIGSHRMHSCEAINIIAISFIVCGRRECNNLFGCSERPTQIYLLCANLNCIIWQNCDVDRITTTNNCDLC